MIIVLHKPYGVLSQFTPELGCSWRTLAEFDLPQGVYPIGRLDADSEGMLLLSDEKDLVAKILDPDNAHTRTYWVQVEFAILQQSIERLKCGVSIQGRLTRPCDARILDTPPNLPDRLPPVRRRDTIPTTWIEITLTEGKNRQVRRMTAAVGHPTLRLIRVGIGNLQLSALGLDIGQWCRLNAVQRTLLLERSQ